MQMDRNNKFRTSLTLTAALIAASMSQSASALPEVDVGSRPLVAMNMQVQTVDAAATTSDLENDSTAPDEDETAQGQ